MGSGNAGSGSAVDAHTSQCRTPRDPGGFDTQSAGRNAYQALAYGYDKVGRILGIDNQIGQPNANGTATGAIQVVPSIQTFAYDELDRLKDALGVTSDKTKLERYALAFQYDAIHNITKKTQSHWVDQNAKRLDQKKTATTGPTATPPARTPSPTPPPTSASAPTGSTPTATRRAGRVT